MSHTCPICHTPLTAVSRYPRYLLPAPRVRQSANGSPAGFSNVSLSAVNEVRYIDNGAAYGSHDCRIGGIACRADDALLGGIVIEVNR